MKLTRDMVQYFAPSHSYSSCSDSDLANGLYSSEYGPRCTRCGLLQVISEYDGELPVEFKSYAWIDRIA